MIKQINVKNLGPVMEEINWELSKLNLVYGKNETGKTYLVEFLIRSLFKTKGWKLRPSTGRGKIIVEGLEKKPTTFSPSSSKKLEDFLLKTRSGLPSDFSKLLVVKGAEAELGEGKADKIILKRYLSSKEILDTIRERIPKTVQESVIQNNEIIGANRGDIKRRKELIQKLRQINALFKKINTKYLGGERKILEDKKNLLERKLEEMDKAKRYFAYTLSQKLEVLRRKRDKFDDDKIEELSKRVDIYWKDKEKYNQKQKRCGRLSKDIAHYAWAKEAYGIYSGLIQQKPLYAGSNILLLIALILMASTGIFSILNYPIFAVASLIGGLIFILLYVRKLRKSTEESSKIAELEKIGNEYQKRFGESLTDLAKLKEKVEYMQETYHEHKTLRGQLEEERIELDVQKKEISKLSKRKKNYSNLMLKRMNISKKKYPLPLTNINMIN